MKRFIFIAATIVLICVSIFYFLSVPYGRAEAIAEGGVLDLTGYDFNDAIIPLNGEWEFYHGQLITPDDFQDGKTESGAYIQVPMSWDRAGYPLKGFATYRLTVLTSEPEVLVHIPKITFSSTVWINGQKVSEAGRPGEMREETAPGIRTAFANIRPENGRLEIVAQAASWNWFVAGLRNGWEIGRPTAMLEDIITRYALLALAMGAMLVLALYHLVLFLYRRNEWVYLAFALALLFYSLRHYTA